MRRLDIDSNFGQVAETIENHYAESPLGRLLVKAERAELTDLVKKLESESGQPGWKTWKFLHRTIGVESIDELRFAHRDSALELLALLLRCAELENELAQPADPINESPELAQAYSAMRSIDAALKKERKTNSWNERRLSEMDGELKQARKIFDRQENLLRDSHDQVLSLKAALVVSKKRINRLLAISCLLATALVAGLFGAGLAR